MVLADSKNTLKCISCILIKLIEFKHHQLISPSITAHSQASLHYFKVQVAALSWFTPPSHVILK